MNTGPHIRAVGGDETDPSAEALVEGDAQSPALSEQYVVDEDQEWAEDTPAPRSFSWVVPTLAMSIVVGWTGFFGWANRSAMLTDGTSQQWIGWITAWAVPVLLVVGLWLLVMRTSSREAHRFGDAAHVLSVESERLEERLHRINRELSMARDFLTTQSRELEFLGRSASERISEHAGRLQELVQDNGAQVDAIASVSTTAMENMERLRDNLPVIATSARDVSNQIGSAGRTATLQLDELVSGFARLNEFGKASERQVGSLRDRIDLALDELDARLDQLDTAASDRFAALRTDSEAFRTELDGREIDALANIRTRAAALRSEMDELSQAQNEDENTALADLRARIRILGDDAAAAAQSIRDGEEAALTSWRDQVEALHERLKTVLAEVTRLDAQAIDGSNRKLQALVAEAEDVDLRLAQREELFDAQIAQRRENFAAIEDGALAALEERLVALDSVLIERRDTQAVHIRALAEQGEALAERVAELGTQMGAVSEQGRETGDALTVSVANLRDTLAQTRGSLEGTNEAVVGLTDSSVRLLELIQASARHAKDDLPVAIAAFEHRLADAEGRTDHLRATMDEAREAGTALGETVDQASDQSRQAIASIGEFRTSLSGTIAEQAEALDGLRDRLDAIDTQNAVVAGRAREELTAAIAELEQRARGALFSIENDQAARIRKLADRVGEASAAAIDRAVEERASEAIGSLDVASERATAASREAALFLRDQLAKVNELASNLESRVGRAREMAEEQVDNDFSRRVALITESLNSNAIDIGKVLSTDVTDRAWTSYLRGDRGIFTRRAVRLLDNTEAREIAEIYDADPDFREHVSRYIHDFEAMLRTLLSTRDGHALGVTVLSSDIGKLYVALAQAIERLRE
ncbi:hypothetical protein A9995_00880 [Erythrobacter sp. QSSC1-22B]|uniref:hypothetical protein n=1 Tax=Erythrobacter sp. QSSC1-22B TaxID=1860125 RepID=UPI0008051BD2|nr:hypothetical protein [Erythrobacter sp. QSSC1-22B]OBX20317.1 hypothetical protein A9995_00880 [Erythrobacter sp. QSSC1-22B]